MRITTKGRYALRAITNLALSNTKKPKAIKTIATEENISAEFLEQIFFKLKKAGIIESVRGPGGGFVFTTDPATVTVKAIFIAVEEGLNLTPCTSCTDEPPEFNCEKTNTCLVYEIWQDASDHISAFFDSVTLYSIMEKNRSRQLTQLLNETSVLVN